MRRAAHALAAALAASALLGGATTWRELGAIHDRWRDVPHADAARAPALRAGVDPRPFEAAAGRLARGDRYFVHTPPGDARVFVDEGTVVRTYAAYALLPAVQVADPADADVVVSYGAAPEDLRLPFSSVERLPGDVEASLARVRR